MYGGSGGGVDAGPTFPDRTCQCRCDLRLDQRCPALHAAQSRDPGTQRGEPDLLGSGDVVAMIGPIFRRTPAAVVRKDQEGRPATVGRLGLQCAPEFRQRGVRGVQ